MEVTCFTVGMFQVNTYLLKDTATGQYAIVDTGETDELVHRLKALSTPPDIKMILSLTHTHLDHAGVFNFFCKSIGTFQPICQLRTALF